MIIWDAELVADDEVFCAVPGQVTKVADCFIEVACGMGNLRITLLSVEGKNIGPKILITSRRQ